METITRYEDETMEPCSTWKNCLWRNSWTTQLTQVQSWWSRIQTAGWKKLWQPEVLSFFSYSELYHFIRVWYQCESYDNGMWYRTSARVRTGRSGGYIRPDGVLQLFGDNAFPRTTDYIRINTSESSNDNWFHQYYGTRYFQEPKILK